MGFLQAAACLPKPIMAGGTIGVRRLRKTEAERGAATSRWVAEGIHRSRNSRLWPFWAGTTILRAAKGRDRRSLCVACSVRRKRIGSGCGDGLKNIFVLPSSGLVNMSKESPHLESLLAKLRPFQRSAFEFAVSGVADSRGKPSAKRNRNYAGDSSDGWVTKSKAPRQVAGAGTGRLLIGDEMGLG